MRDFYAYDHYRDFIRDRIKADEHRWGLQSRLAKAAGCQQAYLSQVLKGQTELTPEQGMGICLFWKLSDRETEFFLLLLQRDRAGQKTLKDFLTQKIETIRHENEDLSKRLKKTSFDPGESETLYYSSWHWTALHILVSIPEYETLEKVATRLNMPQEFVEDSLKRLQEMGLVQYAQGRWTFGSGEMHIPKQSVLVSVHHNNWRQRAVEDSKNPRSDGVHYTGVHSLSKKDYEVLKTKVLNLIEEAQKIVGPSPEEELIAFTADIFKV